MEGRLHTCESGNRVPIRCGMFGHYCSGECLSVAWSGRCLCVPTPSVTSGRQPSELLLTGSRLSWTTVGS